MVCVTVCAVKTQHIPMAFSKPRKMANREAGVLFGVSRAGENRARIGHGVGLRETGNRSELVDWFI